MNINQKILLNLSSKVWIRSLERSGLFRALTSREGIEHYQVVKFNEIWRDAYSDVPFYEEWRKRYGLPENIAGLNELEQWPILTKRELQMAGETLVRRSGLPDYYAMTGGSTGEPLRFGMFGDRGTLSSGTWISRSLYGYYPGIRQFLLLGHHHLYGKGFLRYTKRVVRSIKDVFSNFKRFSAYDLSHGAMKSACSCLLNFSPKVVIGYSAAIVALCRANSDRRDEVRNLGIKFVLCTAGPLTNSEEELIENFFAAPICMEYGSVEAGLIAYTEPFTGHYRVFWDTHLLETNKDEAEMYKNLVTRLTRCYMPLIRYDIGDYLELLPGQTVRPHAFRSVIGRPSDIVKLDNGISFFGALIGDCVKQVEKVLANQTIVKRDCLEINVLASSRIEETDKDIICNRLRLTVSGLQGVEIKVNQCSELRTTVGGKTPLILYE